MPSVHIQRWTAGIATLLVFVLLSVCVAAPLHAHGDAKDACTVCQAHHSPASTEHGAPHILPPALSASRAPADIEPAARVFHRSVRGGRAPPCFA